MDTGHASKVLSLARFCFWTPCFDPPLLQSKKLCAQTWSQSLTSWLHSKIAVFSSNLLAKINWMTQTQRGALWIWTGTSWTWSTFTKRAPKCCSLFFCSWVCQTSMSLQIPRDLWWDPSWSNSPLSSSVGVYCLTFLCFLQMENPLFNFSLF